MMILIFGLRLDLAIAVPRHRGRIGGLEWKNARLFALFSLYLTVAYHRVIGPPFPAAYRRGHDLARS
jgi:hypothetical protein